MRIFGSNSFPLVKEYLGVDFTKDKPFLKTENKTHVSSCALKALNGYTKPEMEQEIIMDLLIRKLERQDISDPKLMEGLDGDEAQFVRKEVDHLLAHVFDKMKENDLDPEGIRKARHKLALELTRHKNNHFHHSIDLIRNYNSKVASKNRELAVREKENPVAATSPKDINEAVRKMENTPNKQMGQSREAMSAYYLQNPAKMSGLNLGADVKRHVNYLSARIGSRVLEFKNPEEYIKGLCEGAKLPDAAQRSIVEAWHKEKSSNFDASFDAFHGKLSNGKEESGKRLAQLFTAMSQIHYLGPGGYVKRLLKASEREGAKSIAYQFDKNGDVAVKSHCTFHRPDCEIKVVNTMKNSAAKPSEWTSNVEVVIEAHIGHTDKEMRERLKQIDAQVVRPLLEHGFHVRVTGH